MGGPREVETVPAAPFWQSEYKNGRDAVLHLNNLLRRDPDNAPLLARRAALYLDLGSPGQAIKDVNRALELEPTLSHAMITRAAIALSTQAQGPVLAPRSAPGMDDRVTAEEISQARADLQRALELDPGNARAQALLAKAHRLSGDPASAMPLLDQALETDDTLGLAYLESALSLTDLEQYEEAAERWEDLVALRPDAVDLLLESAKAQWNAEEFGSAEDMLLRAAALRRDDPEIFRQLALVAASEGDEDEALEYDAKARRKAALLGTSYSSLLMVSTPDEDGEVEVRPAHMPLIRQVAEVEEPASAPEGEAEAEVRERPAPQRDLMAEARQALKEKDPALALALISEHFDQQPPSAADYCLQARTLAALDERDMAMDAARKAMDEEPENACGYHNLGVLLARDDPQQALGVLSQGLEQASDAAAMRNERGKLYLLLKRFDEAEQDFAACIEADPNTAVYHLHRAIARYQRGNYQDALDDADRFLLMKPNAAEGYRTRAAIHQKLGNQEEADRDLESERRLGQS